MPILRNNEVLKTFYCTSEHLASSEISALGMTGSTTAFSINNNFLTTYCVFISVPSTVEGS